MFTTIYACVRYQKEVCHAKRAHEMEEHGKGSRPASGTTGNV